MQTQEVRPRLAVVARHGNSVVIAKGSQHNCIGNDIQVEIVGGSDTHPLPMNMSYWFSMMIDYARVIKTHCPNEIDGSKMWAIPPDGVEPFIKNASQWLSMPDAEKIRKVFHNRQREKAPSQRQKKSRQRRTR